MASMAFYIYMFMHCYDVLGQVLTQWLILLPYYWKVEWLNLSKLNQNINIEIFPLANLTIKIEIKYLPIALYFEFFGLIT